MGKTTVLRVKRLRDEPSPPSTFTLQPFASLIQPSSSSKNVNAISSSKLKKQKANEDATQLTQLMHNSTFLKKIGHRVRTIIPDHISSSSNTTTTPVTTEHQNRNRLQSDGNNQALPIEKNNRTANNSSRSKNQRAIVFRRVINGIKNNSIINKNGDKKRKLDVVQVVDALLDSITSRPSCTPTAISSADNNEQISTKNHKDGHVDEYGPYSHQHQSKRKRISLQMVETRTMSGTEFWNAQRTQQQQQQAQEASSSSAGKGQKITSKIALRARMKRDAAATTSQRLTVPQSLPSSRQQRQKQKSKNVILDPLSKRIDASLCSLTAMATIPSTQQQHLLHPNGPTNNTNDPHNLMASHLDLLQSNIVPTKSKSKYLNWSCTNGTGTFLHCTALLNCVDIARYLCKEYAAILDFTVRDDGGLTVREVAESCSSRDIVEVIDHYAGMIGENSGGVEGCSKSKNHVEANGRQDRNAVEKEGGDYVYDLYYCEEGEDNDDKKKNDGEEDVTNRNIECRGEEQYSRERDEMNVESGNTKITGDLSVATDQSDVTTHQETMLSTEQRQQCSPLAAEAKNVPIIETQNTRSTVSLSMGAGESQENKISSSSNKSTDITPITVEMHGSVGYWDEYGELVLEATKISNHDNHGKDADMMTNDDEDELDSNCEEFDGNDYPEDEDEDENDNEALFSEMPRQHYIRSDSFDDGHLDPEYESGAFMTATMNGVVGRYNTIASDSDYDDDNSNKVSDFRNQEVDLSNYEGFGQHDFKRGDGFYADCNTNIEDDAEDDAYSNYTGQTWGNQISSAETQYAYDPDLD